MFYPEIINRYLLVLKFKYPFQTPAQNCDMPFSGQHLMWMLEAVRDSETMPDTKKHRWLGFVQGVLSYQGLINVDEERDITRPIFNGE